MIAKITTKKRAEFFDNGGSLSDLLRAVADAIDENAVPTAHNTLVRVEYGLGPSGWQTWCFGAVLEWEE